MHFHDFYAFAPPTNPGRSALGGRRSSTTASALHLRTPASERTPAISPGRSVLLGLVGRVTSSERNKEVSDNYYKGSEGSGNKRTAAEPPQEKAILTK
jgi:hypothetical protein